MGVDPDPIFRLSDYVCQEIFHDLTLNASLLGVLTLDITRKKWSSYIVTGVS